MRLYSGKIWTLDCFMNVFNLSFCNVIIKLKKKVNLLEKKNYAAVNPFTDSRILYIIHNPEKNILPEHITNQI